MADPDSRENRNVDGLPEPDPLDLGMYYDQRNRSFLIGLDLDIREKFLDEQKKAYRKEQNIRENDYQRMLEAERDLALRKGEQSRADLFQQLIKKAKAKEEEDGEKYRVRERAILDLHAFTLRAYRTRNDKADDEVKDGAMEAMDQVGELMDPVLHQKELTMLKNPNKIPPWKADMGESGKLFWLGFFIRMLASWRLSSCTMDENVYLSEPLEGEELEDFRKMFQEAEEQEANRTPKTLEDSTTSLNVKVKHENEPEELKIDCGADNSDSPPAD
ncbi:hypothetical protein BS50DRAFT_655778 [Corynespora cassiicola Philippines]|uniref:Uncharacterized protein n=1 Tax=Corynespora cassiicola Philippines TaxID=1448308 RepID=A0A2T2N474_CORCC|nr:hypothetical protein BS50DRAFT_655778 [Corynespora cassiicola Philippines]